VLLLADMTTTKAEMVSQLCKKAHVSKEDATNLVEGTFEIIKAFLERGEPVKISGFGIFVVRTKRPRKGRNPTTGAEILIPRHKVVTFKASPIMKKSVATTQSD
jgi:integration host factor subunit alpha